MYAREQGYKFEHERDRILAAARHIQHIQSLFKRGKLTRAQKRALTKLNELYREVAKEADQEEIGKLGTDEMISATSTPFGKPMSTPSTDRQDSATRKPGIRRGKRKATATRACNAKIIADNLEQHWVFIDAPSENQVSAAGDGRIEYTFTSLGRSK